MKPGKIWKGQEGHKQKKTLNEKKRIITNSREPNEVERNENRKVKNEKKTKKELRH